MLNRSASLAMSTNIIKALPGKLDIKRHSPSILYVSVPKESEYDDAYLKCSVRQNVIEQYLKEENLNEIMFTVSGVETSIRKLNSWKSPDEYDM